MCILKTELTENGNVRLFAATEYKNNKLLFVCYEWTPKMELCFCWLAK